MNRSERDRVGIILCAHKNRGHIVEVTLDEAMEVLSKTKGECRYCGEQMVRGRGKLHNRSPSLDRINNETILTKDNIQFICKECNTTKGDRTEKEFIEYLKRVAQS